jgi:hypothetical protein
MADVADSARRVRLAALDAGSHNVALRAGDAELRAVMTLLDRFGISDLNVISDLEKATELARAFAHVGRWHPDFGELTAKRLEATGHDELADLVRSTAVPSLRIEGAAS